MSAVPPKTATSQPNRRPRRTTNWQIACFASVLLTVVVLLLTVVIPGLQGRGDIDLSPGFDIARILAVIIGASLAVIFGTQAKNACDAKPKGATAAQPDPAKARPQT